MLDLPEELSDIIDEFIGDKNVLLPISKIFYSKYGPSVRHRRRLRAVRYGIILEYLLKPSNDHYIRCEIIRLTCDLSIILNMVSCYEHMFIFHRWYDNIYIPQHRLNAKIMNFGEVDRDPDQIDNPQQFRDICYTYGSYPYNRDIFASYYASMC
jgi:hypothetical protein